MVRRHIFERKLDRPTGFQIVPQHISICDIQAKMGMKVDDILDAVEAGEREIPTVEELIAELPTIDWNDSVMELI